jgi:glycosyltransferase A (GT-A) superfamily protein (DUF2064 family)
LNSLDQTAILIFSRYANEEANEKKYYKNVGKKQGVEIAGQLIDYTLTQAQNSGLPVYTCYSDKQIGSTFGERLANCIEVVFAHNHSNIIITGSDSPTITTNIINRTAANLNQQKAVLAPSKDGGVYLIGLTKQAYQRKQFIDLPWLTSDVFNALTNYLLLLNITSCNETQGEDIDNISCLYQWLAIDTTHLLSAIYKFILANCNKIAKESLISVLIEDAVLLKTLLRGPPQIAS